MSEVPYKVLVLGAGASLAYGFPLGSQLRRDILNFQVDYAIQAGLCASLTSQERDEFERFKNLFLESQITSIDAFLGRRPEFSEIGKKCIAAILFRYEKRKSLFSEFSDKDHWYQYLFNYFARNNWEELNFEDIAIVSFNYDRSLQHFLHVALCSAYGKSAEEASHKLKSLRMVHVYGSLSEEFPDSLTYPKYDGELDAEKVELAARGLIVIPEGRSDSPSLVKAREWLAGANQICFLGFGFDSINVERLAEGGACEVSASLQDGIHVRYICGSRIGLYDAEMKKAFMALVRQPLYESEVRNFVEMNCTMTLRATQFLYRGL